MRNKYELCLSSFVGAHTGIAICRARALRIHGQAGMCVATMTIDAESATDIEWKHHAVPFADARNCFACLLNHSHDFVSDHRALVEIRATLEHVQVAAADAAGGH